MHHQWLKTISESYEKIKLEQELVSLVEDIHKANPTLTEQEIQTFILSELKIPSKSAMQRAQMASKMRGLLGNLKGKVAHGFIRVADKLQDVPGASAVIGPIASKLFGGGRTPDRTTTAGDLVTAAAGADPKTIPVRGLADRTTPEGVREAGKLSPEEQSARVAAHVRSDRYGEAIKRLDARADGQAVPGGAADSAALRDLERLHTSRASKGLAPATQATAIRGDSVVGVTRMPMQFKPEPKPEPKPAEPKPATGGRKPRGRRAKQ